MKVCCLKICISIIYFVWSKVSPGSDQDAAEDQQGGRPFVKELEAPVIDGDRVDLQETTGDLSHGSH